MIQILIEEASSTVAQKILSEAQMFLPGIDANSEPESYTGIYAMHKYWSKKPHNLVSEYIKRFSNAGEIVLDAFCGSGITPIESVRLGRRAIGIDINPIAVFISRMGLSHVDIKALEYEFATLKRKVSNTINSLYFTECSECHSEAITTHTIWERGVPKEVWYKSGT